MASKKNISEKENFGPVLRLIEGRSVKHADGRYKRNYQALQSYSSEPVINAQTFLALTLINKDVTSGSVE